jgi:rhodanese-related sulfurtransferase
MTQEVQNLTPAEVAELVRQKQAVLVDVREPVEFFADRIEDAQLVPLSSFDPFRLPKGRVVFQCGSGKRSLRAIQLSAAAGLDHHEHLEGGLAAWKAAGLPTTRG